MKVLITGGAGFIGSTIASACLDAGHVPIILDNFSVGRREFTRGRAHYAGDISDGALLDHIVADHPDLAAVVHCAAFVLVPESVERPLRYYVNNVAQSIVLFEHLARLGLDRVVFSSSASIYAPAADLTVDENSSLAPGSPYAASKAMVEQVLSDICHAGSVRALSLRYFNPIGADPQLRTGPQIANATHVLGRLMQAHSAGRPFTIFGTDWPTPDGTGIRDYIHVWDLAQAHVRALDRFDDIVDRYEVVNVGTGFGTTVRTLISEFERVTGSTLDVREGPARPGDVAGSYTRTDKAHSLLGWRAQHSVADGIHDALAWTARRP